MAQTAIEWTSYLGANGVPVQGYTFNAWLGCDKVSPACRICYITRTTPLRARGMKHGDPRQRTVESTWKNPLAWNRKAEREGVRPRVFTNSLADWLDDKVPLDWLADLLDLMRTTPNLDWLALTKRPQNWRSRMDFALECVMQRPVTADRDTLVAWIKQWIQGVPPTNVWVGVTVENQKYADERIPVLLTIPAIIRFLSMEPLLGPVNISEGIHCPHCGYTRTDMGLYMDHHLCKGPGPGIDWVIAGGESGDKNDTPVPSHPDWFRVILKQCRAAGVPFFFKQRGDWTWMEMPETPEENDEPLLPMDWRKHPEKYLCIERDGSHGDGYNGRGAEFVVRVGKHKAGRKLDGQIYSEFPKPQTS